MSAPQAATVAATVVPPAAFALAVAAFWAGVGPGVVVAGVVALVAVVLAAVHHAEVVAHRIGEPFGTLVLALAVTVIEASLVLSLMFGGGPGVAVLARDTIYAAVMIICNGVVGVCILVGGLAHREQSFRVDGAGTGFGALVAMTSLSIVLPNYTTSTPSGTYAASQLAFVAVASAALWSVFVFVQTVRHRDYFLPPADRAGGDGHAPPPSRGAAWASFALLVVALLATVGLAKLLSPAIERGLVAAGAPASALGVAIALVVLMPESWAAVRAARANRLQTSMNLAIGSALASIGLTVPVVALAAIATDLPIVLGISPKDTVMLAVTFVVSAFTLSTGRTHLMQGAIHLVLFAAFLVLAVVP